MYPCSQSVCCFEGFSFHRCVVSDTAVDVIERLHITCGGKASHLTEVDVVERLHISKKADVVERLHITCGGKASHLTEG